jgi:DNA segregation ATPase FtsK/SpoIIIE, S-DNA-T family
MSKQRKSNRQNNKFRNEIYGIIIIALSLIIGLSIYKKPLGAAGELFRNFFLGLFGIGSFLFPLITLAIGLALVANKGRFKIKLRFLSLCALIYNILLIIHLSYSSKNIKLDFIDKMWASYDLGLQLRGGGLISEFIDSPLIYILGIVGSYILLVCSSIIFIVLATEISISEVLNSVIDKLKLKIKNSKNERVLTKKVSIVPKSQPKLEVVEEVEKQRYEENIDKIDKKIKILDFLKTDSTDREKENINDLGIKESEEEIKNEIDINSIREVEYVFPKIDLLTENRVKSNSHDKKELLSNAKVLEDTLQSFNVDAKVIQVSRGPSVTRYELQPSPGVKVSRIVNLADDIALNLATSSVRIEAPIPGKAAVGIEVPNREVVAVTLREVLESNEFLEFNSKLAFGLGKDISGKCILADISKMPHLLIAGATGSGKSVCINTLITSLVYKSSPNDVKMLLIDPKVVELSVYNGIPHLLIPVVTDPKKAASALFWAVNEMTQRYKLFADSNVRNIESYNKLMESTGVSPKIPQIVIIIDELADLMMVAANDVEDAICRLAQMARAAGMHLVIATQRPSVDVITGVIKANIPSRISFAVSSQIDSRTILDMSGAEKLLGRGDMLFLPIGENKPIRIQGAFISEKEVENVVEYLKTSATANYNTEIIEEIESKSEVASSNSSDEVDELLQEAIQTAFDYGQVSASMLQRRLRVGFNRAARLVEEMELRGIVSPQDGSKPRQILISKDELENMF